MQGGFVGYHLYAPPVRLDKFEGQETVATFNLSGDVKSAQRFLCQDIPRRFVGKNVCHTMVYDQGVLDRHLAFAPRTRAMELFLETRPGGRDQRLVDLQRDALWDHLFTGT